MPDLVKFILVILAIWVVYQVFTTILFTLSQKSSCQTNQKREDV